MTLDRMVIHFLKTAFFALVGIGFFAITIYQVFYCPSIGMIAFAAAGFFLCVIKLQQLLGDDF